ncbi:MULTISPECIES: PLP-dependent aminotransferase family protein [Paenibacillus]|uniref:aminotransferase-like domain-containing protein n=1 Tax=Paenibacillus TaxID=44249 RepID=UPI00202552AF|nr:PLP-dependent aminotransferase family protein [Paenibacillus polymyxa]URJ42769.1 PLP-dependent aminotransferase family protein [Paenibacillus polymyxa]
MEHKFSGMARTQGSSMVRDILKLTQGTDVLSLAGGLPADAFFPIEAVAKAYERVFRLGGTTALQYGLTEGYIPLRERLAAIMSSQGISVTRDNIIMTTGSQQTIDLVSRVLLDPQDTVLVESPTYLAALQVFNSYGANIVSVDTDSNGMQLEDLEAKIKKHQPKFVYVIPTFSNPAGSVWSMERRTGVVELCRKYGTLIFEDDPYGRLKFDENLNFPSLFSIDQQLGGDSHVMYTSTFSKTVAPGVRSGWLVADQAIVVKVANAKQSADLHSSSIDQRALNELLDFFDLDGHIRTVSAEYHTRMLRLTSLMKERQWEGITWNDALGGMFMWVTLPEGFRSDRLLQLAIEEGVAFVPGQVFYADLSGSNHMRINFTHTDPSLLPKAVDRLDRALKMYTEESVVKSVR